MHAHIGFQGCADSLQDLGHCIHFLLAQGSRYYRFNGFSIELDLIEVPSLLLEELLADFEVVSQMAINLMGEEIPREYHEVLARSRDMDRAMTVRTQTLYSLISLDLHSNLDSRGKFIGSTTQLVASLYEQFSNFGYTKGTNMQHSFSNLVDYDCRYYTYVFSQMIVKDMAGRFLEIVRGEVTDGGLEFRRKVLEPGSTRDAVELVRDYLGRDFDPGAYFRWLDRETDCMESVAR